MDSGSMSAGTTTQSNPFPGLRPFRTDEHHLFFGREEQTAALLGLLREHRFLAVVGSSGSGKSSLVRAGLIPALHRGTMALVGSSWEVVVLRPGGNPVSHLAQALLDADLYDAEDPEVLPRLRATLTRSIFGLVEAVRQSTGPDPESNLLLVVDQFEELFRFRQRDVSSEETATAFVNLLLTASAEPDRRIYVVITMRSDYLGDCAQIPGLAEAVNRGEYLIPRLGRDQRRDAIEKPVGVGGARIAPRLVQIMLNDLGDDPDQLPVLQHALMRTWDAWVADHAAEEPIDLRHYEATGGMTAALSLHADHVFDGLPDDHHREVAARLFKALTVKGPDNRGIRRPTRLGRLAQILGAKEETVARIVEAYRRPGVTFLMPGARAELAPDTVIDLSHESLMRVWGRLRAWVDDEAQSARVYRRLSETAALWENREAGLYHDPDLQIARSWRDEERPVAAWAEQYGGGFERAMAFLDRSRESAEAAARAREEARRRELEQAKALAEAERRRLALQRRAGKRIKAFAAVLGVVAALALVAFVIAARARREAVVNAELAASSAELAKSKEEAATRAAAQAERSAAELERTLVASDFGQGVERIEAGEAADGLSSLARALRTDAGFWPAGVRALSVLASGRFPLETFEPIRQENVIVTYRHNAKGGLLFTSDAVEGEAPQRCVWDLRTGKKLYSVANGKKLTSDIQWTDDGALLVGYLPEDKSIRAWRARTGEEAWKPILAEALQSFRVGNHPDFGSVVLARHGDATLQVWRLDSAEAVTPPLKKAAAVWGLGFTPDCRRFWEAHSDATIAVWETAGGAFVAEFSTRPHAVRQDGVFWSPDGETLVCRDTQGKRVAWWRLGATSSSASWLEFEDAVEVWFLPRGGPMRAEAKGGGAEEGPAEGGGAKIAILSRGGPERPLRVDVHDLATRERTARVESPRPPQIVFVLDEEGRSATLRFPIVGAAEANVLRLWDLETGALLKEIVTPALIRQAGLSPEGRRLFTVSLANEVMLWDVFTGAPLLKKPLDLEGDVSLAFTPEGEKLVTHDGERGVVDLWDSRTGERLAEPIEQRFASSLLFPLEAHRLLIWESILTTSGTFRKQTEGSFSLLDIGPRPALFEPLLDGASGVSAVAMFTPDGRTIVAYGKERAADPFALMAWDAATRRLRFVAPFPPNVFGYPDTFRISPEAKRAIMGASDGRVRVWDLESGEILREIVVGDAVLSLDLDGDGTTIATGTNLGKVRVWDLATGNPLHDPLEHGSAEIRTLSFSPDGRLLATGSLDFKARLAEVATGKPVCEPISTDNIVNGSPFSPDGTHLAVTPFSGDVIVVDAATGGVVRRLPHNDACRISRFSPDGRLLAVGVGGRISLPVGKVHLWDWREGRQAVRPLDADGPVEYLEFSADGALLVTGTILDGRGTVRAWDVESGSPLTEPVVGRAMVASVGFNPGATEVVACWRDGTVRVIDLPPRGTPQPDWLPRLSEAVAGRRKVPGRGGVEPVGLAELEAVRREIEAVAASREETSGGPEGSAGHGRPGGTEATQLDDPHARWATWLFSVPEERTVSPGSTMPFREYLARLRRSARIEDLQEALRLEPSDALAQARLGLSLLDALGGQGDIADGLRRHWEETAEWYVRRAVDVAPDDAEVWAIRSEALQRLGRLSEASAAVRRALEIDPGRVEATSANASYLRAVTLAGEGKWDEADAAFGEALDRVSRSARDGGRDAAAPLLGVLASLEPTRAPSGFHDVRLPDPIPGTFESFEAVPEGGLPEGWSASRSSAVDARLGALSAVGRLDSSRSDLFADWVVVSCDRAAAGNWQNGAGGRLLSPATRERVNGAFPAPLLDGRFLLALAASPPGARAQHLLTRDFDCAGRRGVHVSFKSAYEQDAHGMGSLEYSVDEGTTWLPVVYLLDAPAVVYDAAGKVDAEATFAKPRAEVPVFADEHGRVRGGAWGDFIAAVPSAELGPHIQGRRAGDAEESKRVEVFRLPAADGRPKVRLRFTHVGRTGRYWGIDDLGLYEIPGGEAAKEIEIVDVTRDARVLAGVGLSTLLFGHPQRRALDPRDFRNVTASEPKRAAASPAAPGATEADRRRLADARLLLRRAAALAPEDPWVLLASTVASARSGEGDDAFEAVREFLAREPVGRLAAPALSAVLVSKGDALEGRGDAAAAGILYELAQVLEPTQGLSDAGLRERLAEAGLVGASEGLVRRGSEWRFLDDGTDPGASWKYPTFDDSLWFRGKARLGYGGDGETTVVSFGPDPQNRHVTTYFRSDFETAEVARFVQLRFQVQRDDGIVVYLNGEEVLRDNMPRGPIEPMTLAVAFVSEADEARFFTFDVPATALRSGKNVIAAEVHQQNGNSSDLGFDLELEGIGGMKEVSRPLSDLEAIEERLGIPEELRALLWVSRAARFRGAGDLDRAAEALDRAERLAPAGPAVSYERAMLLLERGAKEATEPAAVQDAEDAARAAYLRAAEGAIGLKTGSRSAGAAFLPEPLRSDIEPIVRPAAESLAVAAGRVAGSGTPRGPLFARWLLGWSEALDPDGQDARRERAEALLLMESPERAIEIAEAALAPGAPGPSAPPRRIREHRGWLRIRERCLRDLGREAEADAVRDEILRAPPRREGLGPRLIDLSAHYNASLYDGRGWHVTDPTVSLSWLPETFVPPDGLEFDLRGVVQLNSGVFSGITETPIRDKDFNAAMRREYPDDVTGIPVGLEARALHLLVGANYGREDPDVEVARILIRYEDGTEDALPLRYGADIWDWYLGLNPRIDPARVAWRDFTQDRGLFRVTWTNPHPERTVRSLDFVSGERKAAPFLVAVTAE